MAGRVPELVCTYYKQKALSPLPDIEPRFFGPPARTVVTLSRFSSLDTDPENSYNPEDPSVKTPLNHAELCSIAY